MQIPPLTMEIEQVYNQFMAGNPRTLAVTSANPGEGVTSVAMALAHRNLLAGDSTLLVDLNLYRPALNNMLGGDDDFFLPPSPEASPLLENPQLVSTCEKSPAITGIPAPRRRDAIMKLRKPGALEACITEWQQDFHTIIFDTSPLNRLNANNIPAERVASACDGCLLVVRAGRTTDVMVQTAVEKLNKADAVLLGCIFNDRDNPSLQYEMLREIDRLPKFCKGLAKRIKRRIKRNNLLTMEV